MPLASARGGAEIALMRFLEGVPAGRRGTIFLCYLEDGPLVEWTRAQAYSAVVIPAARLRQPDRWAGCVLGIRRWLRGQQIEVVLSWMVKAHLYAGVAGRSLGIRTLWWQHGIPVRRGLDRAASWIPAHRILACSMAAAAAQRLITGGGTEVCPVYPPVDLALAKQAAAGGPYRAQLGLPSRKLIVGMIARLESWKGVHVFLSAAAQLRRIRTDLFFVVVGGEHPFDPGYAASLQAQLRDEGLQEDVLLCGHQVNPLEWLHSMDIVVSASFGEPFGMVVIEAQALGKPVIATRSGGPAEIITDGVDGILLEAGNAAELVATVLKLAGDATLRQRLGAAARLRAEAFGIPRFVAQVLQTSEEAGP
jgi:glycosyltransferase involved in cell wall biosynthesis